MPLTPEEWEAFRDEPDEELVRDRAQAIAEIRSQRAYARSQFEIEAEFRKMQGLT